MSREGDKGRGRGEEETGRETEEERR